MCHSHELKKAVDTADVDTQLKSECETIQALIDILTKTAIFNAMFMENFHGKIIQITTILFQIQWI